MLLSMALVFTACEDDRDSNPTLVQPTTFTLNNPVDDIDRRGRCRYYRNRICQLCHIEVCICRLLWRHGCR